MKFPRSLSLGVAVLILGSAMCSALAQRSEAAASSPLTLIRNPKLKEWREPHGIWQMVGAVTLDPNNKMKLATEPGTGVIVNNPSGATVNLLSKAEHGDVEAHVEFTVPKSSNSGVYFQGRYEVQILDSWGVATPTSGDCGGIYERWANGHGFEGHAPKVNASKPPGEWQTLDVTFRAPRFKGGKKVENGRFIKVTLNGQVIHENVEVTGPTRAAVYETTEAPMGPLMLQGDHGPVAYRNIVIKRVNLP